MKILKTPPLECQPIRTLNFGYKHLLKTTWLKGQLPTVTHGLYGDTLTVDNVSIEHLVPKSKGGHTEIANIALATKKNNIYRSSKNLRDVLSWEQAANYLKQFKGIKAENGFDGDFYIKRVSPTIERLLRQ